uniref:Envelope glycoprotein n=1 Tax=Naja naja TaxID=35670 RepID=A0A8C6VAB2_NAJNA
MGHYPQIWNSLQQPGPGDYIRLQKGSEDVTCPGDGRGSWEEDDAPTGRDGWPLCNPVKISFTSEGMKYKEWERGVTSGGRIYAAGYDYGNIFITRKVALPPSPPLGPNSKVVQYSFLQSRTSTPHPLLSLLNSTFSFLNASQPNWTTSCWLCASAVPPFYEAVGSIKTPSMNKSDSNCRWRNGTQTLHSLTGTGRCLGNVPHNYSSYCDNTTTLYNGMHYVSIWQPYNNSDKHRENFTTSFKDFFFLPGPNSWWACSTGLTACVHGPTLASQQGFCIQVQILPKILYYPPDQMLQQCSSPPCLQKRKVVTALTLSILLGLGVAGASTGVTALFTGRQQYDSLRLDIDTDLERIETSITHLQESLTSLSEVVLQNRRGLDLLFLQEGGLCVALREECCFYADHSGIVGDSMDKLREGLARRRREHAEQQSWYQNMFNLSPWLTTLLSAIAGPLILLLLVCAVAPCVFNRALRFIKTPLATVQAMVLAAPETVELLKAPYQHSSDEEANLQPLHSDNPRVPLM